jgi:Ner family transcriptional regulator
VYISTIKELAMEKDFNGNWSWIKLHLELKGLTFGKLARIHGIDKTCFTKVKTHPMPKNERIIADLLGLEPWELWPDRYDPDHNPNRFSSRYPAHKLIFDNTPDKLKSNIKKSKILS